jgi:hypothetical protein
MTEAALIPMALAIGIRQEREACANLRKEVELRGVHTSDYEDGFWDALAKYEDMIRARGEQ